MVKKKVTLEAGYGLHLNNKSDSVNVWLFLLRSTL